MTWLLTLLMSAAFAIENFDGCETTLTVTKTTKIPLHAHQIAIRGPLEAFWETGMEESTGWSVIDEFVYNEVAPRIDTSLYLLKDGDYVFLLDDLNTIVAEGYYAEHFEPGQVNILGREINVCPNRPRLFKDAAFTERAMDDTEFMRKFADACPAVVIQNIDPETRARLQKTLGPWLDRHRIIAKGDSRRRTFGNHVIDPKSFEEVLRGRVDLERRPLSDGSHYLTATLLSGDRTERIRLGERVLLLNARGQVIEERVLDHQLLDHEKALREAAEVVLVRRIF